MESSVIIDPFGYEHLTSLRSVLIAMSSLVFGIN